MNRNGARWFVAGFVAASILAACAFAVHYLRQNAERRSPPSSDSSLTYLPAGAAIDKFRRLVAWPGKEKIPCPPQSGRTVVLLILGQSNAANHGGDRLAAKNGLGTVNYLNGKCFFAGSPLLGATGQGGEPWTRVADLLIASGATDSVVLAPVAISGSAIDRWLPSNDLGTLLRDTIGMLHGSSYRPTHVLWVQGEADFYRGTSGLEYGAALSGVTRLLRDSGVGAPIYVAIASKCAFRPEWKANNAVALAQRVAVASGSGIVEGPDLDQILQTDDRHDGCHLTGRGLEKVAAAWVTALTAVR